MVEQARENLPVKVDLAIYTHMLGVPGQYKSVALMLGYKLDFSCCANKDGFCRDNHIWLPLITLSIFKFLVAFNNSH